MSACISADRAWFLIRENHKLEAAEKEHVFACLRCQAFLLQFTKLAKAAGFTVSIELPEDRQKLA